MLKEKTGYILNKPLAHSHFALGNNILQIKRVHSVSAAVHSHTFLPKKSLL